jgi:RNase adaptor protein for sRNA GlmZ degradation
VSIYQSKSENTEKPNIVIISGISGSGKSSALKILEDRGFFCVDNMPMILLPKFFELGLAARLKNILFVIDIREKSFLKEFEDYIKFLKRRAYFFRRKRRRSNKEIFRNKKKTSSLGKRYSYGG